MTAGRDHAAERRSLIIGMASVVAAVVCFALSFSIIKWPGVKGSVIAWWRLVVSAVLWWALLVARRWRSGTPSATTRRWPP